MKPIIALIIVSLLVACSVSEEDGFTYDLVASVKSVKVLSKDNGELNLNVELEVPDPCHGFHRREVDVVSDTVSVRYYSKSKGDICPQVLSYIEINDVLKLTPNKTYLFRFWEFEETYFDTTISLN